MALCITTVHIRTILTSLIYNTTLTLKTQVHTASSRDVSAHTSASPGTAELASTPAPALKLGPSRARVRCGAEYESPSGERFILRLSEILARNGNDGTATAATSLSSAVVGWPPVDLPLFISSVEATQVVPAELTPQTQQRAAVAAAAAEKKKKEEEKKKGKKKKKKKEKKWKKSKNKKKQQQKQRQKQKQKQKQQKYDAEGGAPTATIAMKKATRMSSSSSVKERTLWEDVDVKKHGSSYARSKRAAAGEEKKKERGGKVPAWAAVTTGGGKGKVDRKKEEDEDEEKTTKHIQKQKLEEDMLQLRRIFIVTSDTWDDRASVRLAPCVRFLRMNTNRRAEQQRYVHALTNRTSTLITLSFILFILFVVFISIQLRVQLQRLRWLRRRCSWRWW